MQQKAENKHKIQSDQSPDKQQKHYDSDNFQHSIHPFLRRNNCLNGSFRAINREITSKETQQYNSAFTALAPLHFNIKKAFKNNCILVYFAYICMFFRILIFPTQCSE